jgi:hypothetical protein
MRCISDLSTEGSPNPLYMELENLLHEFFIQGGTRYDPSLDDLYVTTRHGAPEPQLSSYLARLPEDVRCLLKDGESQSRIVGEAELDLLDFLFNYKNNRVLTLVGHVGVGKTTLLRYVLFGLRIKCESLQKFLPITLDCLEVCSNQLDYGDLIYATQHAVDHSIQACRPTYDADALSRLNSDFDFTKATRAHKTARSSSFLSYISGLKNCFKEHEIILVLDNLDHCHADIVPAVYSLARSVFKVSEVFVIVAMRHTTYRTQRETSQERGAFYRFSIHIDPPELTEVIARRIAKATGRYSAIMTAKSGHQIKIQDALGAFQNAAEHILDRRVQFQFLSGLCNNDIRRALAYFVEFMKYKDLDQRLVFATAGENSGGISQSRERRGGLFSHLLDGLMLGINQYYRGSNSPIANLFRFERGALVSYIIQYSLLAILGYRSNLERKDHIIGWLSELSYSERDIIALIEKLLNKRLIYSPEDEIDISRIRHLRITDSGLFYLEHLAQNPQYLYNAVYDIPLEHTKFTDAASDSFRTRLASIIELLEQVSTEESNRLAYTEGDHSVVVAGYARFGLLSRRILSAAESLVDDAYFARSRSAHEAAREFPNESESVRKKIRDNEKNIKKAIEHRDIQDQGSENERRDFAFPLGDYGTVTISAPLEICPSTRTDVNVEVKFDRGKLNDQELVVCLDSNFQGWTFTDLRPMHRAGSDRFRCAFTLPLLPERQAFPASQITIIQGTDPLAYHELT